MSGNSEGRGWLDGRSAVITAMDWVQCFRIENGKIGETWMKGLGTKSEGDDSTFENLGNVRSPECLA